MSTPTAGDRHNRLIILLIAGIPLTIVLAASWLWYFVAEGDLDLLGAIGTANNGILLDPPRQINDTRFENDAGASFAWDDLESRWTMVVVNEGAVCGQSCERRLYFTRQIHIALGKDFNRVRRSFISDTPIAEGRIDIPAELPEGWPDGLEDDGLAGYLARAHSGLVAVKTSASALSTLFPETATVASGWYLVDPAGWIMMRYEDDLDYKAVISDLKFLLKNSGDS